MPLYEWDMLFQTSTRTKRKTFWLKDWYISWSILVGRSKPQFLVSTSFTILSQDSNNHDAAGGLELHRHLMLKIDTSLPYLSYISMHTPPLEVPTGNILILCYAPTNAIGTYNNTIGLSIPMHWQEPWVNKLHGIWWNCDVIAMCGNVSEEARNISP